MGYLTPDSVYEGRCDLDSASKKHSFFGNMLDIWSMPAIVSINIYNYHVNQNSPPPRRQGKSKPAIVSPKSSTATTGRDDADAAKKSFKDGHKDKCNYMGGCCFVTNLNSPFFHC